MSEAKHYTHEEHGNDHYYGRPLFDIRRCSGEDQFRVYDSYLVRDEDGKLGFIGDGVTWFMNYVANAGNFAFNPIREEDLLWSLWHSAYIRKTDQEHFLFPVIIGDFYRLCSGEKTIGMFNDEVVAPHPNSSRSFTTRCKYF